METEDQLLNRQLGEYRIESLLGKGGMARVYLGVDVNLNRPVAIKVIDTPYQSESDYLERFRREAVAIAQLQHPNIIQLYRFGEEQGLLFMAMQYIEGADLANILESYQKDGEFIDPVSAARIVREVCDALDFAHRRGIIHRDIKPSNIMLDMQGRAVLTDFGLVLLADIGTRGEVLGSPSYLSPEQALSSAKAVPSSDFYSVGVILYEMFTGRRPFTGEEPLDIAMKHVMEPPPRPRNIRPDLSPELEAVILQAMAKKPQHRFPDGASLAKALERAIT